MKPYLISFVFVLVLLSCKKSEYEGYSLTASGIDYKIYALGDVKNTLVDSQMVEFNLRIFSSTDSLLFTGEVSKMYFSNRDTGLVEFLGLLAVGDSASGYLFSRKIKDIFSDSSSEKVRLEIGITSQSNYTSWSFYQAYPELSKDLEIKEQAQLLRLLKPFENDSVEVVGGMFLIRQVVGIGDLPRSQDEVSVHYVTYNANEEVLDSTYERDQPFTYIIGQQGQVLKGFDYGIRKLRKGEKATFILPSELAFGSSGSSTGIAKGFETLIYEVEVVDIKRASNLIENEI